MVCKKLLQLPQMFSFLEPAHPEVTVKSWLNKNLSVHTFYRQFAI